VERLAILEEKICSLQSEINLNCQSQNDEVDDLLFGDAHKEG